MEAIEHKTAASFQRLAAMRGVNCLVAWSERERQYVVDGERMGRSIHTLYTWLEKQPGVKP